MATSRQTLLADLGAEMGDVVTGTASGAGSDTDDLVDTSADTPFDTVDDSRRFEGHWLYSVTQTAEHRISSYTVASQKVTSGGAFGSSLDADAYEIHGLMSRGDKVTCLNRALQDRLRYRTVTPLSLVPDGDMETSGVTNWTAGDADVAVKETTVVIRGTQSLKLVTTAANGYLRTASIDVEENVGYRVEALVKAAATGSVVKIVAYDVTNSAAISLSGDPDWESADGLDWKRLYATFTTPAGCRQIQIRLQDETTAKTSYWDDVTLLHVNRRQIPLPSWCDGPDKLEWVYVRSGYDPYRWTFTPVQNCRASFQADAVQPGIVSVSEEAVGQVLYLAGFRPYATLATDSATTTAPAAWVKAATAVEILETLLDRNSGGDTEALEKKLARWRRKLIVAARQYKPKREYSPIRFREPA